MPPVPGRLSLHGMVFSLDGSQNRSWRAPDQGLWRPGRGAVRIWTTAAAQAADAHPAYPPVSV